MSRGRQADLSRGRKRGPKLSKKKILAHASRYKGPRRHVVIGHDGIPCPRCDRPTQVRVHREVTAKHRRQPYYFERWYYCMNPSCETRQIMRDEFMVLNGPEAADAGPRALAQLGGADGGV